ncbi:MAG: DUF3987 domain-containing protein, partial [Thermoguttaceae bacterium]
MATTSEYTSRNALQIAERCNLFFNKPKVSLPIREHYDALINDLFDLAPSIGDESVYVGLTDAAKKMFDEYDNAMTRKWNAAPDDDGSAIAKLSRYVLRFALLLHTVRRWEEWREARNENVDCELQLIDFVKMPIDTPTMGDAIAIANYFEGQALSMNSFVST